VKKKGGRERLIPKIWSQTVIRWGGDCTEERLGGERPSEPDEKKRLSFRWEKRTAGTKRAGRSRG